MKDEIAAYLDILCLDAPEFLAGYAAAPEMSRLAGVGLFCGVDYGRVFRPRYFYSRLFHSLGVARLVWRFTRDPRQTLSGLFHDISTPVFSHCVDFMMGDALTQSATEAGTRSCIAGSIHIMDMLAAAGIPLDAVADYHLYPIADNDSPRLSADRLEYTLSTALILMDGWTLDDVRCATEHLAELTNEDGAPEIGFTDLRAAETFSRMSTAITTLYQGNPDKLTLSLLGDILKMAIGAGVFTHGELYLMTEAEAIGRITHSGDARLCRAWENFANLSVVHSANEKPEGVYSARVPVKKRYIVPLVQVRGKTARLTDVSASARRALQEFLSYEDLPYGYVDFAL